MDGNIINALRASTPNTHQKICHWCSSQLCCLVISHILCHSEQSRLCTNIPRPKQTAGVVGRTDTLLEEEDADDDNLVEDNEVSDLYPLSPISRVNMLQVFVDYWIPFSSHWMFIVNKFFRGIISIQIYIYIYIDWLQSIFTQDVQSDDFQQLVG